MTESNSTTSTYCPSCGVAKTAENATKNKNRPDGLNAYCKKCSKIKMAASYQKHKDARRIYGKKHYENNRTEYARRSEIWKKSNPRRRRELDAAYRANNAEKLRETHKQDYEKHKEKRVLKAKEYRQANPHKEAEKVRLRQTRKRRAMPEWADREAIKAIYRQSAFATRVTGVKYHVDHYFPLKSDVVCGLHNQFNLRIVPAVANLSKSNKMPLEN